MQAEAKAGGQGASARQWCWALRALNPGALIPRALEACGLLTKPESYVFFFPQAEAKAEAGALGKTLVSGLLTGWEQHQMFPSAEVRCSLGQAGDIEAETTVRESHISTTIITVLMSEAAGSRCRLDQQYEVKVTVR